MDTWEYNWWDDRTIEQNETNFCPVLNDFCYEGNDACKDCLTLKAFNVSLKSEVMLWALN